MNATKPFLTITFLAVSFSCFALKAESKHNYDSCMKVNSHLEQSRREAHCSLWSKPRLPVDKQITECKKIYNEVAGEEKISENIVNAHCQGGYYTSHIVRFSNSEFREKYKSCLRAYKENRSLSTGLTGAQDWYGKCILNIDNFKQPDSENIHQLRQSLNNTERSNIIDKSDRESADSDSNNPARSADRQ